MIFRGFSGMGWGRGQPYGQGALGENPRKSLWGRGGEGGPSRARGFFGENPRKKLYFGAGTKVEFSGIFPSLLSTSDYSKNFECQKSLLRHHTKGRALFF